jgi:hypothetical protein
VHHGAGVAAVTEAGRRGGHELPPGVDLARDEVRGDPEAAIARGAALMSTSAQMVLAGVEEHGARYVERRAGDVMDAWGRVPADQRAGARTAVADASRAAAARVVAELRDLLARDPAAQARTPLEIVRTLRHEPGAVLAALGVPPVARDPFEERAVPDDPYALAPRTLGDLGDPDLGAMLLAWGVGKATVLRARAAVAQNARTSRKDVENLSIGDGGDGTKRSTLGTITHRARRAVAALRARRTARPEERGA